MQGIPFSELESLAERLARISDEAALKAAGYDEATETARLGKALFLGHSRGTGRAVAELRGLIAARSPVPDIPPATPPSGEKGSQS